MAGTLSFDRSGREGASARADRLFAAARSSDDPMSPEEAIQRVYEDAEQNLPSNVDRRSPSAALWSSFAANFSGEEDEDEKDVDVRLPSGKTDWEAPEELVALERDLDRPFREMVERQEWKRRQNVRNRAEAAVGVPLSTRVPSSETNPPVKSTESIGAKRPRSPTSANRDDPLGDLKQIEAEEKSRADVAERVLQLQASEEDAFDDRTALEIAADELEFRLPPVEEKQHPPKKDEEDKDDLPIPGDVKDDDDEEEEDDELEESLQERLRNGDPETVAKLLGRVLRWEDGGDKPPRELHIDWSAITELETDKPKRSQAPSSLSNS